MVRSDFYDGTGFIKLNDGECMAALMKSNKGAIVPILIGRDEASVKYVVSSTGRVVGAAAPWHDKKTNTDYYYSECSRIEKYTERSVDTFSLPMTDINTNGTISAIETVFNILEDEKYKEALGGIRFEQASDVKIQATGTASGGRGRPIKYKDSVLS